MPDSLAYDHPTVKVARRVRRLYYALWSFAIYAVLSTSISVALMVDMSQQLQDSCSSRQAARTAIRTELAKRTGWTDADQHELDVNLPVRVQC
jgi:hypothetical protein